LKTQGPDGPNLKRKRRSISKTKEKKKRQTETHKLGGGVTKKEDTTQNQTSQPKRGTRAHAVRAKGKGGKTEQNRGD